MFSNPFVNFLNGAQNGQNVPANRPADGGTNNYGVAGAVFGAGYNFGNVGDSFRRGAWYNTPLNYDMSSTPAQFNSTLLSDYRVQLWTSCKIVETPKSESKPAAQDNTSNTNNNNSSDAGQKMIDYAKQFEGKTYAEMSKIMRDAGYRFDSRAWCADFVSFVAGKSIGEENLASWYKNCHRASCPGVHKAAQDGGGLVAEVSNGTINTSNVKKGDAVIFDWSNRGGAYNHIGIVDKIEGGYVYAWEGNTGGNGGMVAYKKRPLSDVRCFTRIA